MIYTNMMNGFVRLKMKVGDGCNIRAVFRSHALLCVLSLQPSFSYLRHQLSHSYSTAEIWRVMDIKLRGGKNSSLKICPTPTPSYTLAPAFLWNHHSLLFCGGGRFHLSL